VSTPQPTFRLVLRAVPGGGPVEVRLRSLLKVALRAFGFRCVKVEEVPVEPPAQEQATSKRVSK
jgi:hypothetical protein